MCKIKHLQLLLEFHSAGASERFTAPPIVTDLQQADGLVLRRIAICTVPGAVWRLLFWRKFRV
jgi:hypothetical protein